jgi:GDP-mannose 6-dehydrogenase
MNDRRAGSRRKGARGPRRLETDCRVNISIFGLGYVGAVSLACLARDGHQVIGVDIDAHKIAQINAGQTPVVEEGMIDLMKQVVADGRARASDDALGAVLATDLSFICVGTPSAANGSQDLSAVTASAAALGRALRGKPGSHVFVFRSTLVPGTVEEVLVPILERESGKQEGRDFFVAFQPEFLREGSSVRDYDHPPFTIVGCRHDGAEAAIRELFGHLPCAVHRTSLRTAEMLKVCCNNFHALKITFANETARLCDALGVNPFEVMDLVCGDTQLNISRAYLRPGFAFGGSCLPKDLRATTHLAKMRDVEMPMLAGVLSSNDRHLDLAVSRVLASGARRVGLIGLSFKAGTDDLRESPMVTLAERLLGKGIRLQIYDPEVFMSRLIGANRRFIETHLPHVGELLHDRIEDLIDQCDVLIVAMNNPTALAALQQRARPEQQVIDLVGLPQLQALPCSLEGLCW